MTETLYTKSLETPVGVMQALVSDEGVCILEFAKPDRDILLANRLKKWFPLATISTDHHPTLDEVEHWLDAYFKQEFDRLPTLRLVPRGTEFEMRVWKEMLKLAPGQTMSYADLAATLGSPNASRAVGNSSRRNSIALIIPCHRVVGSNGSLTGYGGGLNQKEWLLKHEGNRPSSGRKESQRELAWS